MVQARKLEANCQRKLEELQRKLKEEEEQCRVWHGLSRLGCGRICR